MQLYTRENYGSGITETTARIAENGASETAGVLGMRSSVYDDDTIGIV
jgi:hypothetical protein